MNSTPNSNRKQIVIYGKTNAGKSSLINTLVNQQVSLVSEKPGTTTDPVVKAMELIPVGPVLFIDTAGLEDNTDLGELRVKRTLDTLKRADFALYIMDANDIDEKSLAKSRLEFKKYNIPNLIVINKIDAVEDNVIKELKNKFPEAILLSVKEGIGVKDLKDELIDRLQNEEEDLPILGDLLHYNSKVILVVPIDSEAPKGRLILPQVQCLRECLDYGIKSYVVRDTELESALEDIKDVDLVITDSQAFKKVQEIVPKNIKLTSFSTLFARHKGDINAFTDGVRKIKDLTKDSKILIAESCTHNISHEDIGRIKIPRLLNNYVGAELDYEFIVGYDFPEDIEKYDLIIHCGACMVNRKTVLNRIRYCQDKGIPITNYGVALSFLTGILNRNLEIFNL